MSSSPRFNARGIPVLYTYYSDHEPYILNGSFQIDNEGTEPLKFAVSKVWCQVGGQTLPQDSFYVYRLLDQYEENPKDIVLPPLGTIQFDVTFPQISAVPYLQQEIQVGIELSVAGASVTVFSDYQITRRTRRGGKK